MNSKELLRALNDLEKSYVEARMRTTELIKKVAKDIVGKDVNPQKIKVFGEVWMDMKEILENVYANLSEAQKLDDDTSPKINPLSSRYYSYTRRYLEAALLLHSDKPVCLEHGREMEMCDCGCGMYRCSICGSESKDKQDTSHQRIVQVNEEGNWSKVSRPDLATADLVYENNYNGTYHILKNRYGREPEDVSAEKLVIILQDIINREVK